jgi:hypothetical protein
MTLAAVLWDAVAVVLLAGVAFGGAFCVVVWAANNCPEPKASKRRIWVTFFIVNPFRILDASKIPRPARQFNCKEGVAQVPLSGLAGLQDPLYGKTARLKT